MQKMKATELIVDYMLYPRGDVDTQHIGYMVRSLEAGHALPPILVDRKSRRIVDGIHRWHAYRKWSGNDDVEIECILKEYKNDAQLFLDSVRFNATHGSALTTFDRTRCLLKAEELKISDEEIADALHLTVEKAGELKQERVGRMRMAAIEGSKVIGFSGENLIPLKRTVRHMAGRTLSKRQVEINEHLGGMEPLFYVNQLLMLIEGEMLDLSDEKLMGGLGKLKMALESLEAKK